MKTINYTKSIQLKVTEVDNQLTVYLNPDTPGGAKMAEVYKRFVSGFATPNLNDTIDLTGTIADLGSSTILSAIASNFAGGGNLAFEIIADGASAFKVGTSLTDYNSQQWAVSIKKN